ncbi:hypothetical protein APHMUC_0463 [Anaplasma phagocytophilum str. ApMUC09]|uniref:Uncharacterized protein n=1 Tax=Anaplasma phagocytophilum str. ApMUC09 TaxID=1359152 RepID=A0A0F3NBT8_ANAPH|nr:hypothetical protein APHMUC_0463 [Anaplasma phagocytophilum str. ApMUC09]
MKIGQALYDSSPSGCYIAASAYAPVRGAVTRSTLEQRIRIRKR